MLRRVFGSNVPIVLFTLLLPALAVLTLAYFYAAPSEASLAGPLYDRLFEPVNQYPLVSLGLGLIVLFAGALLLNSIFNEHEFADKVNYLPAFIYFLFGISALPWLYFNPVFLANVFLLLALRRLFRIYRIHNATAMLFDAGLYMSIAILIYPPLAICLPFLWVGMTQLRSTTFREWLVPLLGICTVAFYIAVAYWWRERLPNIDEFLNFQGRYTFGSDHSAVGGHWLLWLLGFSMVPVGLGALIFIGGMSSSTVHRKNTKRTFLWFSIFLLIVFVYVGFLDTPDVGSAGLLALPIAVFSSRFFAMEKRKWLLEFILYLWVLLIILRMLYSGVF